MVLSETQTPHQQNGYNARTYTIHWLSELNKMIHDEPCISGKFCAGLSLGIPSCKMQSNTGLTESRNAAEYVADSRGSQEIFLEKSDICAGNEEPGRLDTGGKGEAGGCQAEDMISGSLVPHPVATTLVADSILSCPHHCSGPPRCPLTPFHLLSPTGVRIILSKHR